MNTDALKLARAVLLFWNGKEWDEGNQREWEELTGVKECTSKRLCDFAREIMVRSAEQ